MTLTSSTSFLVSSHRPERCQNMYYLFIWLIITSTLVRTTKAWDSEELEIFDVVEEVNRNFYELLGVSQEADTKEIKKAFRRLSLVLHPDKNDAPDADVQFRQLVAVYEILSDDSKRTRYNEVLVNGLPNWKNALYYYRRVRKMGLLEMVVILFLIVTVGQYAVLWAAYAEKRYTAEQLFSSKMKKIQKKQKKLKTDETDSVQDILLDLPKPSVYDLLPFQTVRLFWLAVTGVPQGYQMLQALLAERRRQQLEEAEESSEESADDDGEEKREKRVRRRKAFLPPELTETDSCLLDPAAEPDNDTPAPQPRKIIIGGLWTDDDLTELARLVKKYPGGTSQRWERIADAMCRSVAEVTHMARKLKEEFYKPAPSNQTEELPSVEFKPSKVKTKGGKLGKNLTDVPQEEEGVESSQSLEQIIDNWSQPQQKALENALTKFPKGTSERWVKIANCVPGKNMEECIMRYKHLVELVKKKKEQQQAPPSPPEMENGLNSDEPEPVSSPS